MKMVFTRSAGAFPCIALIVLVACVGAPVWAQFVTEYSIPAAGAGPLGITTGPDSNLWFAERSGNNIGKMTTGGVFTEYSVPTANSVPLGITSGPDGNLWFTEGNGNKIAKVTTTGVFTEYSIPTPGSGPSGITAGPDGNLWFTESANKIGKVTTTGTFTEYTIPTANSAPIGITTGPDGNLWFTEGNGNKIGKVTPSGMFTEYTVPTSLSGPDAIAAGSDGNLWFTEPDASPNQIGKVTITGTFTEYTVPTLADDHLAGITAGPDGNLWFTEDLDFASKIGRLTITGTLTEYFIPSTNSSPVGITTGPDGNLWFTEFTGERIGSLSPTAPGCPGTSLTGCRSPGKSLFLLKDKLTDARKDKLTWKWIKGASTSQLEFGDPPSTTNYALCIYVGTASAALVREIVVPAGSGTWSTITTKGYKYSSPITEGITKVLLKGSDQNKSKILVKGKGSLPDDVPFSLYATNTPVTVQFVNEDNGLCWGASYSSSQLSYDTAVLRGEAP